MEYKKSIQELSLIDDFLFTEAMTDKEMAEATVRLIVERTTGLVIDNITIEAQKVLNGIDTGNHGIRMDVAITQRSGNGDNAELIRFFDIEPNNRKDANLPKQSRYYQALDDVKLLETGVDYDKLPELWTIWILPYDPFGENQMIYFVKNTVEGFNEIDYNDGVRKVFLYTGGKYGGSESLKALLGYIQNSREENAVDLDLKELHKNIERLKRNKEIGVKYMRMQEYLKYEIMDARKAAREEGLAEGREEGREEGRIETARLAKLTEMLLNENKYEELKQAAIDEVYRLRLFEEYGI